MVGDFFSRLACYDMAENENYIYFFDNEKCILYEIEKETKKNRVLVEKDFFQTYSSIDLVGQKLILTPWNADTILIYDIEKECVHEVEVEFSKNEFFEKGIERQRFWDSVAFGEYVYMLGYSYPIIIKLNTVTFQIEYLTEWYTDIKGQENKDGNVYLVHGELIDNAVWVSCGFCNVLFKINVLDNKFEYYEVPLIKGGCGVFTFDGNNFWIGEWMSNYENIVCWNPRSNNTEIIKLTRKSSEVWCPHHSIVSYKDYILVFPFVNDVIYKVEKKSKSVTESIMNSFCNVKILNRKCWKILSLVYSQENLRFVTGDYIWHEYNLKENKHKSYELLNCDDILLKKYVSEHMKNQNSICEENGFLYIFLKYVLSVEE